MKRDASSPDAYRADVSGAQRELLEAIRDLIFEVAPETEETIDCVTSQADGSAVEH